MSRASAQPSNFTSLCSWTDSLILCAIDYSSCATCVSCLCSALIKVTLCIGVVLFLSSRWLDLVKKHKGMDISIYAIAMPTQFGSFNTFGLQYRLCPGSHGAQSGANMSYPEAARKTWTSQGVRRPPMSRCGYHPETSVGRPNCTHYCQS